MRSDYQTTPKQSWLRFLWSIPVTKVIIGLWVLAFLGSFVGLTPWLMYVPTTLPMSLTGIITYPLVFSQDEIVNLLLCSFCFYMFSAEMERRWGSLRYLLCLLVTNAVAVVVFEAGARIVLQELVPIAGPWLLVTAVIAAWAWLKRAETVNFWGVLPMQGKWLGWISIVVLVFSFPLSYVRDARLFLLAPFAFGGVGFMVLYARYHQTRGWIPRPPRPAQGRAPLRHPSSTLWGRLTAPLRAWKRRRDLDRLRRTIKWE